MGHRADLLPPDERNPRLDLSGRKQALQGGDEIQIGPPENLREPHALSQEGCHRVGHDPGEHGDGDDQPQQDAPWHEKHQRTEHSSHAGSVPAETTGTCRYWTGPAGRTWRARMVPWMATTGSWGMLPPEPYRTIQFETFWADRLWFEAHPGASEYRRDYVPGEF